MIQLAIDDSQLTLMIQLAIDDSQLINSDDSQLTLTV
jgi:hypothetical protein